MLVLFFGVGFCVAFFFLDSFDSPSPEGEADGKQNEGKQNEQTPSQQGGQQTQQPNGNQRQPYNGYQKPNGYYHQNGNK